VPLLVRAPLSPRKMWFGNKYCFRSLPGWRSWPQHATKRLANHFATGCQDGMAAHWLHGQRYIRQKNAELRHSCCSCLSKTES
jgi:hypothetical protein